MDLFDSPEFEAHVNELLEKWHVPGLAIGITQNGVAKSKGFGKAILTKGEEREVDSDTVFEIASCSKSLTAAAVALLVADDEKYPHVQWNTPVSQLLPEDFVLENEEYTKNVTVEDIVSHRSGLPRHDFASMNSDAAKPDTIQSITRKLRYLEIAAPIRTKFMYNNLMFTAAAYLVEYVSGSPFGEFLKIRIWDPLEMKSTNLLSRVAIEKGFTVAQPYKWDEESSDFVAVKMQDAPEAFGAGLVNTTADDYIRWLSALLTKKEPITQEVYDGLTKPRTVDDEDDLPPYTSTEIYCAGLSSHFYRGFQVIAHTGGDPGVATTLFFMPEKDFGCVIFTNAEGGGNIYQILRHELVDAVLKVPKDERIDWATRERELEDKDEREFEEKKEKRRKELSPETDGKATPQPGSLDRYIGRYWNDGYEEMKVVVNADDKLAIDASDRTMGFTMVLEHLSGGTKYIAHTTDSYDGDANEMEAEFVFEDERVILLGLNLEDDLESARIWFGKMDDNANSKLAVR